ncbi:Cu(I)-responsive transcriptional regulator [Rhizobium sp. BE258]|uniref:Cu(I)-responsive transcriptional regulator n=1 Tax=Rhizobium sp. BE258 TaxID=2817722 RepID=UPI00285F6F42|nr:Cu(I)-responsive transcriptional regulator [Rhizobium sp. BE258]MDR7142107.1 Cu(I)-responsive transcriptional regulator [Rhizobium sp. BE258]
MNIGEASDRSGLPAKTIRYYEDIGLVRPERGGNGYRDYDLSDVHKLRFLQRSRGLGFSVEECRQLLALYEDKSRASADVKDIAQTKLTEIDQKIREMMELRRALEHLVHACHGNDRPDCPILDGLSDGKAV